MKDFSFQLIISTVNLENPYLFCKERNINSDTIIINQCNEIKYEEIEFNSNRIQIFSFSERGTGLSRLDGQIHATADIIKFADDDMVFSDTYKTDIINEYKKHPKADLILFSNKVINPKRQQYKVEKFDRVNRIEAVKFGAARISARRDKLLYNRVYFSPLFGPGAKYPGGEDTTFIQDCIKAGLKVYKSPIIISTMEQKESCWFNGYTDGFYTNKGALLKCNFPLISLIGIPILSFKHRNDGKRRLIDLIRLYYQGYKDFKNNE